MQRMLNREPSWARVAADIQSCPEVQEYSVFTDLIIATIIRLDDNGVLFKSGEGGDKWTLTFKTQPTRVVRKFVRPCDLYEWLQNDQEVENLIASRVVVENQSGNKSETPGRKRKRKRTGVEYKDSGKDGDGKDNDNTRKKKPKLFIREDSDLQK